MYFDAIVGGSVLLLLGILIYGPWQWICTDVARQSVFEHRDAIFDLADSGKLSFDSPQYRTIRRSLQKAIRYSHELTIPHLLYVVIMDKKQHESGQSELLRAVDQIEDAETRREVLMHVNLALLALVKMVVLKSPIAVVFLYFPLLVFGNLIPKIKRLVDPVVSKTGEIIQSEAEGSESGLMAT
ncbi:MAG: hypothetical protein WD767_18445 [Alphaproteobacteria bacterium]